MTITDEAVEAHARAMCRAMGLDPDGQPEFNAHRFQHVANWVMYADHARLYLASRAAEAELAATPVPSRHETPAQGASAPTDRAAG
jgi:hypothetical protein